MWWTTSSSHSCDFLDWGAPTSLGWIKCFIIYIKLTIMLSNMLQNSTTQAYSLLKVIHLPISPKMMRSTRIHWLQGKSMYTKFLISIPVREIVTQNHTLMMILLFLRISSMLLTQELMVGVSWRSGVIFLLASSMTQPSLHTVYQHWSLCMSMQAGMRITRTLWCVNVSSSRRLFSLIPRMKGKICLAPSTFISCCYKASRGAMTVATSGQSHLLDDQGDGFVQMWPQS